MEKQIFYSSIGRRVTEISHSLRLYRQLSQFFTRMRITIGVPNVHK
jgi:hypothetical protein